MAETVKQLRARAAKLHKDGDLKEAALCYAKYLQYVPKDAGIWSNLGVLHRKEGRHKLALRAQKRAVELAPNEVGFRGNYANILSDLGHYKQSIEHRKWVLERDPDNLNHMSMIGRCLRGLGQYDAAIEYLNGRIKIYPDDPVPFPEWQGEPLDGKTILVMPEQGFGDAVLFARFIPILKKMGATVYCIVECPLAAVFDGLDGADWTGQSLPKSAPIDYYVNMMDLAGQHFRRAAFLAL